MARYAIMSDVHANPKALETVLADAWERGCGRFVFLGDVTGYGYDAKTALELVRANFDIALLGNHDSACLGRECTRADRMNPNYRLDRLQRAELTAADRAWLRRRGFMRTVAGMAFAHGDFTDPGAWYYVFEDEDAFYSLQVRSEALLFCGHTHHAGVWELDERERVRCLFGAGRERVPNGPESTVFRRRTGCRYLINVGSVGYPRNDFCATYAICDPSADAFELRRLPFDFAHYAASMTARGVDVPIWVRRICELRAEPVRAPSASTSARQE